MTTLKDIFKAEMSRKSRNVSSKRSRRSSTGIFGSSRPYEFKFFNGCLPQILLGPFLNTLTHWILRNTVLYLVNTVTLLKTKSIQIDRKRTKASVVEQQTGKREFIF